MKKSQEIRKNIGSLIYEQQIYQNLDNDTQIDRIQTKIDSLRSKLKLVEMEEVSHDNEEESQG